MTQFPPGPRLGLPTLLRYLGDPYGSTLELFRRWGDPHTTRALGGPMVATREPELIRTILGADPALFEAFGVDLMGPVLGAESLLMLSGEHHRAARKLLTPPFHGERMRNYGRLMQSVAREEARRWKPGEPFAMQHSTQAISLRIILQAVFGITEPDAARSFEDALVASINAVKPELLFIKGLQHEFGGLGPWARMKRLRNAVEQMVYAEIAARREKPAPREDILSMVMAARYDDGGAMSDRQLFETLMTIVVAGHDTAAIATAWALYFAHRDPAVRAKLAAELATLPADPAPEDLVRLPYLEAVCHEALRFRPVAPTIVRLLKAPFQLGTWALPPGTALSASIIGLHNREDLYPDAGAFRPERFLDRTFAPFEFLPFGGGFRRCIGAAFAMYEMKIVLATLMTERPLRLVSDAPVPSRPRSTIIGPSKPIEFALA